MTERKSLLEAVLVPADKLEFIKRGIPSEEEDRAELAKVDSVDKNRTEAREGGYATRSVDKRRFQSRIRDPRPDPTTPDGLEQRLAQSMLIPLATRLHPKTAAALRRAHHERKLGGESPSSQQEIVEEALRRWLVSERYLRE